MNSRPAREPLSFSADDFAQALAQHDYAFQPGKVVRGKAFSYESNGSYIDIGGKSLAFLPIEEASLQPIDDWPQVLPLQEERDFLIVREQDADGQIVLSIRQLEIKALWEKLTEIQADSKTIQVRVTGTNKGGVTVDVQGLQGFIPRSHLVEREDLPALKGQTLAASLLEVDLQRNKLVLSHRLATRSITIRELEVGQLVEGQVSSIQPFGLFIDFAGGTGLLHIKEISQTYIESLTAAFKRGESLKAVIIGIDEARGRVSLSTKVLENQPGEILENRVEVMAEAEVRARRYQNTRGEAGS